MAKGRDSGMPAIEQWESYFDAAGALASLGCLDVQGDAIEFGCGYGTFTIEAARTLSGTMYALDIDPQMVEVTSARISRAGLHNVRVEQRDFVAQGCGRAPASIALALLFNILHIEQPLSLLREAHRVLRSGGIAAIVHWNYDAGTPRGPPLEIRPRPEECRIWGEACGFDCLASSSLPGSPWHWGLALRKP